MNNIAQIFNTNKFKTIVITVAIRTKPTYYDVSKNSLISKILSVSSSRYKTNRDIVQKLEYMNGAVFDISIIKKGEENIILFYLEVLKTNENDVYKALDFLNEIIHNPLTDINNKAFDYDTFDIEKKRLINEIKTIRDNIDEYVINRCIEEMYGKEGFGLGIGYIECLEKINSNELYSYYKNILKSSPFEIIIVGDVNECDIKDYLRNNFIDLLFRNVKFENKIESYRKNENIVFENAQIKQGKLCMGFKTGLSIKNDDIVPLILFNEIFGASPNSRLFLEVREKNGLCYYINSYVYKFTGTMLVQSGIDYKSYDKTVNIIKNVLEDTKKDIRDIEIENAKKSITKIYTEIYDNLYSICDNILDNIIIGYNDKILSIDMYLKKINECSKDDILKAGNRLILDTIYFLSDGGTLL